jgi:hypothetical protein
VSAPPYEGQELLGVAGFAAGVVVVCLAWMVRVCFVTTWVLAAGVLTGAFVSVLVAGAACADGCSVGVPAGAAVCCANAAIGRIARPVATSSPEMRVIVRFLFTGGIVGWTRL